jgi:hypothetical protein
MNDNELLHMFLTGLFLGSVLGFGVGSLACYLLGLRHGSDRQFEADCEALRQEET